jgi:ribonuclease P protein component
VVRKTQEGFPWHYRIVRGADYRSVYSAGHKHHSGRFVLFGKENQLGHHRLGITVSRKVGSAVVRNRTKRLFREIFRKSLAAIPDSLDLVVNAKRECAAAVYRDLREEFLAAAARLGRQIEADKLNKNKVLQDLPAAEEE